MTVVWTGKNLSFKNLNYYFYIEPKYYNLLSKEASRGLYPVVEDCKLLMIMMITTKDKRVLLSYFSSFHYGTPNCEMSCMSLNSRGWTCKHNKSTYQYPPSYRLQNIHTMKMLVFKRSKIYLRFQWMKIRLVLNCIYVRKGYK